MSRTLKTGAEVVPVSEEWVARMGKRMVNFNGMVRIGKHGWLFPKTAPRILDRMVDFKFMRKDVVVMGFPKSGATWLQEALWTMTHNRNLDSPLADEDLFYRSPEISADMFVCKEGMDTSPFQTLNATFQKLCPDKRMEDGAFIQIGEMLPRPRVLKMHSSIALMTPDFLDNHKIVYIARNPKDSMVSYYKYLNNPDNLLYTAGMEEFVLDFMNDDLLFCPYWSHLKEAWQRRDHPNMLFLFYEDMKADPMKALRQLDAFIDTKLTQNQLDNVERHTSFSTMRARGVPFQARVLNLGTTTEENTYFRRGIVGDWMNHFSPELTKKVDDWVVDMSQKTGISFPQHQD